MSEASVEDIQAEVAYLMKLKLSMCDVFLHCIADIDNKIAALRREKRIKEPG